MKKLFFLLTAVLLAVGACKKDTDTDIKKDDDRKPGEVIPYTSGKDAEGSYIQIPELNNRKVYYTTNDSDFPIDTLAAKVEEFYKMMEKGGFNYGGNTGDTLIYGDILRIDKQAFYSTNPNGFNKPFEYKVILEAEYDKLRSITHYQFKFVNSEEVSYRNWQTFEPYSLYFDMTLYLTESRWNDAFIYWGTYCYFVPVVPDFTAFDKKGIYKGILNRGAETIEVRQINNNSITIFSSYFNAEIRGNIQEDGHILFENFYADIPEYGNHFIQNGKGYISYLFINNKPIPYFSQYEFNFEYTHPTWGTSTVTISLRSGTYLHRVE